MRFALIFFLLFGVSTSQGNAQEANEAFQLSMKEQLFIMRYMNQHPIVESPLTLPLIDSHIEAVNNAWRSESGLTDAEVSPYLYYWELNKKLSGLDRGTACYLYSERMVPTFLADLKQFNVEPRPANAYSIRAGFDFIANPERLSCFNDAEDWGGLKTAFDQLPDLITDYLNSEKVEDAEIESLKELRKQIDTLAQLVHAWDASYGANYEAVFLELAAAFVQGVEPTARRVLGRSLWQAFAKNEEHGYALATLDLLSNTLTAVDLDRDTLQVWYQMVDPVQGAERFLSMTASQSPILVASDTRISLTGTYIDLLTGEPTNLADFDGKLVFLDFWATWCAPCIEEIPELKKIVAEFGDEITFLSINADAITDAQDAEGVQAFMEKHGVDYPVLFDQKDRSLAKQLGVQGYPAKFLIDRDGRLLAHPSEGRLFLSLPEVQAYLESSRCACN